MAIALKQISLSAALVALFGLAAYFLAVNGLLPEPTPTTCEPQPLRQMPC